MTWTDRDGTTYTSVADIEAEQYAGMPRHQLLRRFHWKFLPDHVRRIQLRMWELAETWAKQEARQEKGVFLDTDKPQEALLQTYRRLEGELGLLLDVLPEEVEQRRQQAKETRLTQPLEASVVARIHVALGLGHNTDSPQRAQPAAVGIWRALWLGWLIWWYGFTIGWRQKQQRRKQQRRQAKAQALRAEQHRRQQRRK